MDNGSKYESPIKGMWEVNSNLVGLYLKNTLLGEVSTPSRNCISLKGSSFRVTRPQRSKHPNTEYTRHDYTYNYSKFNKGT